MELDPKGKQFRLRSGTDPLAAVPEDSELQREQSLSWEKFGEQISFQLPLAEGTRRWSTDTLFSVPVADSTVQSSEESDGGDYLSPTGGDDPTMAEAIATVMLRKVRAMIMEAEVDVLPYTNKKVNLECVGKLCTSATRLKRELQEAHMDLEEDNEYKLTLAAQAGACRQKLAEFIVTTEELRVVLEKDDKDQQQASKAVHEDIVPIVAKKILAAGRRLVEVEAAYVGATGLDPDDDAELFEKIERLQIIDTQFSEASSDGKKAWELAVEFKLMDEGADLDRAILAARKAKAFASDKVLAWRKEAGIWADKKSSSTHTDLKMPPFLAGLAAKTTIYDFERVEAVPRRHGVQQGGGSQDAQGCCAAAVKRRHCHML